MIMIIMIMTGYHEYVSKSERYSGTQALVSNSDKTLSLSFMLIIIKGNIVSIIMDNMVNFL
jgi:hypothetical protein